MASSEISKNKIKKMVEVEVDGIDKVMLTMTPEEAAAVYVLIGVAGWRKMGDELYNVFCALQKVGFAPFQANSIYMNDTHDKAAEQILKQLIEKVA